MQKEGKAKIISKLQDTLKNCSIGIVTEYRGLKTPDLIDLRKKLKETGAKYEVVKNTLIRRAAEGAGMKQIAEIFDGPIALAYCSKDAPAMARVLSDYIRSTKTTLTIKGGFLDGQLMSAADVSILATLPSREVLLARILGGMQAPIARLLGQFNAPIQGLAGVLQARINQLEKGEAK